MLFVFLPPDIVRVSFHIGSVDPVVIELDQGHSLVVNKRLLVSDLHQTMLLSDLCQQDVVLKGKFGVSSETPSKFPNGFELLNIGDQGHLNIPAKF